MIPQHTLIVKDAISGLRGIPDKSVHCIVTSPPYYRLRSYLGDESPDKHLEIGIENTPDAYVNALVDIFREVRRVLRDDGTVWLNLGDSYMSGKQLIGIPWRVAFALQADGWCLRQDIVWAKGCSGRYRGGSVMPEPVKDRCTKSHEYLFLLSKKPNYYYDNVSIKEPSVEPARTNYKPGKRAYSEGNTEQCNDTRTRRNDGLEAYANGKTCDDRNMRSVWVINTRPFKGAHFASFPPELVEPCIKAGTSEAGCCATCGSPLVRVVERTRILRNELDPSDRRYRPNTYKGAYSGINGKGDAGFSNTTTTGFVPTCNCNSEIVPCTVMDIFSGTGTVAKTAHDLCRSSISIEINPGYVKHYNKRMGIGETLNVGQYTLIVVA